MGVGLGGGGTQQAASITNTRRRVNILQRISNDDDEDDDDDESVASQDQDAASKPRKRLPQWRWWFRCFLLVTLVSMPFLRNKARLNRYRLVVSLSTTSSQRLLSLQPTLESLLDHQERPPDMIYLVLPDQRVLLYENGDATTPQQQQQQQQQQLLYEIPNYLQQYVDQHRVYLLEPHLDLGRFNHILYALEMESFDTRIVCLNDDDDDNAYYYFKEDDDTQPHQKVYPSNFLSTLYREASDHPYAILTQNGFQLDQNQENTTPSPEGRRRRVDIAWGPVLVLQRRFFDVTRLHRILESSPVLGLLQQQPHHHFAISVLAKQQDIPILQIPTPAVIIGNDFRLNLDAPPPNIAKGLLFWQETLRDMPNRGGGRE